MLDILCTTLQAPIFSQLTSRDPALKKKIENIRILEYLLYICFCLFDLILYVPSTIFQLNREGLPGLNQY